MMRVPVHRDFLEAHIGMNKRIMKTLPSNMIRIMRGCWICSMTFISMRQSKFRQTVQINSY